MGSQIVLHFDLHLQSIFNKNVVGAVTTEAHIIQRHSLSLLHCLAPEKSLLHGGSSRYSFITMSSWALYSKFCEYLVIVPWAIVLI